MIKNLVDWAVSVVSPSAGAARQHARQIERSYAGAVSSRLNENKRPKNQSADGELLGPWGADRVRAIARMIVRDNPYAWSALESIIGEVLGAVGIGFQSALETEMGGDEENINEKRDAKFQAWCEVADINGQMTFSEIQILAFREMVEAGESLIRYHKVPKKHNGIYRPVPLALELIEADRLASDQDTYFAGREGGIKIVRGVEQDETGRPLAYWIYPDHPNSPHTFARSPERIPASQIQHLFRKDRISQTRGVSWFAPIVGSTRDLGVYLENEIQASTVASCFTAVITSERKIGQGPVSSGGSATTNEQGTPYQFMQPGLVMNLKPGENVQTVNPGRPNSAAGPWIELLLRGVAAGMGTSYEGVSKDFSQTSYSSSRTSKLENRPRFRRWQQYIMSHLCLRTWDEFCDAAAFAGAEEYPSMSELLEDRRAAAPVELMPPVWEWVDITAEQAASERAINALQSSYAEELGGRGRSWRLTFYRRAKEEALKRSLGLVTPQDAMSQQAIGTGEQALANADKAHSEVMGAGLSSDASLGEDSGGVEVAALALNGAQVASLVGVISQVATGMMPKTSAEAVIKAAFPAFTTEQIKQIIDPITPGNVSADGEVLALDGQAPPATGELAGLSTMQFNRNRKAIEKVLTELATGEISETKARVFLGGIGMKQESIDALIADAADGSVDTLPAAQEAGA